MFEKNMKEYMHVLLQITFPKETHEEILKEPFLKWIFKEISWEITEEDTSNIPGGIPQRISGAIFKEILEQ